MERREASRHDTERGLGSRLCDRVSEAEDLMWQLAKEIGSEDALIQSTRNRVSRAGEG